MATTSFERQENSVSLLDSLKKVLTPYASDRETAFRERNLRGAILLIAIVTLVFAGRQILENDISSSFAWRYVIQFIYLLAAAGAIYKRRLNIATGIMVVYLAQTVAIVSANGYWSPTTVMIIYLVIAIWSLILPWSRLILLLIVYALVVYLAVALLDTQSSPLPSSDSFSAPESAIIVFYGITTIIVAMGYYLFQELTKQRKELKDLVDTLEIRVEERTQEVENAHQEIQKLYLEQVKLVEELRQLDNMKSQFLASMSHELRTPLNAILNFTEFMAIGMLGPVNDKQQDALGKALSSGKHLLSLINDVLDITKIESGMMKLFVEDDLNLQDEIATILATAETLIKDKPIQLIKDIDDNLPIMVGDKRRIRQILLNLVSNASKFTEVGSITLSAKKLDSEILFTVSDTGFGIAKEDQELIFEPFQQTEAGIQHAGGTGLGLPISKRLVEAHGGKLWLESIVGKGTTFYITLPIRSATLLDMIKLPESAKHV